MKIYCDLHIHSCLSPCAEEDMTPNNICGMAHLKGLDAIALSDHNSALNLPYITRAAVRYGLVVVPAIEVTTREEVHILGYFPNVDEALAAGEFFSDHLPNMKNVPKLFGSQLVMDENDQMLAQEERMLIGATDLSLGQCAAAIESHGGVAVPAHINRGANGLLVNLGFIPPGHDFKTVEVTRNLPVDQAAIAGRLMTHTSDAHRLGDILEREFSLTVKENSVEAILYTLKNS